MSEIILRDYQEQIYKDTRKACKECKKGVVVVLACRSRQILHNG